MNLFGFEIGTNKPEPVLSLDRPIRDMAAEVKAFSGSKRYEFEHEDGGVRVRMLSPGRGCAPIVTLSYEGTYYSYSHNLRAEPSPTEAMTPRQYLSAIWPTGSLEELHRLVRLPSTDLVRKVNAEVKERAEALARYLASRPSKLVTLPPSLGELTMLSTKDVSVCLVPDLSHGDSSILLRACWCPSPHMWMNAEAPLDGASDVCARLDNLICTAIEAKQAVAL